MSWAGPRDWRIPLALVMACMAGMPALTFALSSLSEEELSGVSAQDGLTVSLSSSAISASQWKLKMDTSSGVQADSVYMTPNGSATLAASLALDAGAASASSAPAYSIVTHIDRFRLGGSGSNGFLTSVIGDSSRSFGEWSLVTDMDFSMSGRPFIANPSTTKLYLSLSDATLFWRQNSGHATMTMDNINFLWDMPAGAVSLDTGGLRIAGDTTFRIGFDVFYKYNADQNMTSVTSNDRPGIRFSWGGHLYDSLLYVRGGGVWNTASNQATNVSFNTAGTSTSNMPTGMSDGVNFGMRWNYRDASNNTDFLWSIGHITGDQEYLEFGDWKNLEQASGAVPNRYGFDFPLIVFDALNVGSSTNAGGSLCWGSATTAGTASCADTTNGKLLTQVAGTIEGFSTEVNRSGGAAFVQLIRNGNLLAWSNSVRVKRNPSAPVAEDDASYGGNSSGGYSWGLIFTLANINSNLYLYPGGSESDSAGGSRSRGAMFDFLFMTQSFGNWDPTSAADKTTCAATPSSAVCNTARWSQGTHLMVADTAAQMGVGILGASVLLAADDARVWLKDTASGETSPNNYLGGLDLFAPRFRYNIKGLFGGARLPNGYDLIRIGNIDMNLEGLFNFRLSPPPTNIQSGKTAESNDYLGYSGAIRLRCGTVTPFGCTDNAFADSSGSTTASGSGSYISLEEPGKPGVSLAFADLSGDIAITEGVLQLRSAADTDADTAPNSGSKFSTSRADLTIANKVLIGASAATRISDAVSGASVGSGGAAGRALTGNLKFGGNDIMSMAIPAASAYYSLTVRAQ